MAKREIQFRYNTYDHLEVLPDVDQDLLKNALEACEKAYAPYSNFKVGAAIRTTTGEVVTGSNQENGAFPIGQCAERVALYQLVHLEGRLPLDTIAIVVKNDEVTTPATPCGSCRQMLSEYRSYQQSPIRLILGVAGNDEVIEINDINDLLPLAFNGKFLGW